MQLGKREKRFVQAAVVAIGIFCLLQFGVLPVLADRKQLQQRIRDKETDLKEMVRMGEEYGLLKRQSRAAKNVLQRRAAGFTLFSFLEKAAGKAGVKGHIKYMKPSSSKGEGGLKEAMVEMKLDGISLKKLMDYLYRIELAGEAISVKRCAVTENKRKKGALDVVLQVVTLESS